MAAMPADISLSGTKKPVPCLAEDERQIPCYHLNSSGSRDTGPFRVPQCGIAALYSITVTGEARPRLPVSFRGEADSVYSQAAAC